LFDAWFGGDYGNVENVLGNHFAKQIIANVLVDKVKDGYFSEAEAKKILQRCSCMIMRSIFTNFQSQTAFSGADILYGAIKRP
jgi:hypothetical protein